MRTVGWLVCLALAGALLHHFTAGAPVAARAAFALGVLTVAAELGGRLARRWRLPAITGFLVIGMLLRPDWLGAVRTDEVDALGFVADAALALFALRAGLAWRDSFDATGWGRYLTTSLLVPFVLTAGVVYALHPWFPLTVHQPDRDAAAVALVLGALTVVSAPALVWATLGDTARGPVGAAVLRLHVVRDVSAVVLFAVVLAAARPLASDGSLRPAAYLVPLVALGASVLTAGLLAWLAGRLRRLVDIEAGMLWLVVAFGAALAAWSGPVVAALAALLTGLGLSLWDPDTAEILARRFDARGGILTAAAFALVGVRFAWSGIVDWWPWVLMLVAIRAAGLYWGARWAGRGPLMSAPLARAGWLGLISQAGVGVLLAAAGRRAFPEWGVSFEGLAVALIAVNAVIGPACLRWALARRPILVEGASGAT
jgi:Kef-type K+ transport system membrane component KefB